MTTKAMNLSEWIQDEHDKVGELCKRLRDKAGSPPMANLEQWLLDVRERFEHLRAHLVKHMALEEHDGYFTGVLERRPTLGKQVEILRHQHGELARIMESIREELSLTTAEDALLVKDVCARIQMLVTYIEHHEQTENLLATAAFTEDIGTKD